MLTVKFLPSDPNHFIVGTNVVSNMIKFTLLSFLVLGVGPFT